MFRPFIDLLFTLYSIYFIYVINTPRHSHFENVCQADGKKIPVGVDIDGQMLM